MPALPCNFDNNKSKYNISLLIFINLKAYDIVWKIVDNIMHKGLDKNWHGPSRTTYVSLHHSLKQSKVTEEVQCVPHLLY